MMDKVFCTELFKRNKLDVEGLFQNLMYTDINFPEKILYIENEEFQNHLDVDSVLKQFINEFSVSSGRLVGKISEMVLILWSWKIFRNSSHFDVEHLISSIKSITQYDAFLGNCSVQSYENVCREALQWMESPTNTNAFQLPIPWIPCHLYVICRFLVVLVDLISVNLSLATECCNISQGYLNVISSCSSPYVNRISMLLCWLLNDSKISHHLNVSDIQHLMITSCYTLGTTMENMEFAERSCKIDIDEMTHETVSIDPVSPKTDFSSIQLYSIGLCIKKLYVDSMHRLRVIWLHTLQSRSTVEHHRENFILPQEMKSFLQGTDPPLTEQITPRLVETVAHLVEYFEQYLKSTSLVICFEDSWDRSLSVLRDLILHLIQAVILELSLGLILWEGQRLDCLEKLLKKKEKTKKNLVIGPNIGQPLRKLMLNLSSKLAIPPSFNFFLRLPTLLNRFKFLQLAPLLTEALTAGNRSQRRPKVAKGCLDSTPSQTLMRELILEKIKNIFRRYGACSIETPIFELRETLMGKYGEEQKLVFDLKDQGGEQLCLRYDLTVPFARYVATHNVERIKRYHIGKVYRRDEPQVNNGRLREFYQCDLDIAGSFDPMVADAEVLSAFMDALTTFEPCIGEFKIKMSHRLFLDALLQLCQIPTESFKSVCSSIDKLDKLGWASVREELCHSKGVQSNQADKLHQFIQLQGPMIDMLHHLRHHEELSHHDLALKALQDMELLVSYLDHSGLTSRLILDLSLARGLDYYTGIIFEAFIPNNTFVGSIGAGGRYDHLLGMFCSKEIPSVGASLGIERIFRLVELSFQKKQNVLQEGVEFNSAGGFSNNEALPKCLASQLDVFVCSVGSNLQKERMFICKLLRDSNVSADFSYIEKKKLGKQLQQASDLGVPFVVLVGKDELSRGSVKLKRLVYAKQEPRDSTLEPDTTPLELEVPITELVKTILNHKMHFFSNKIHETIFQ